MKCSALHGNLSSLPGAPVHMHAH